MIFRRFIPAVAGLCLLPLLLSMPASGATGSFPVVGTVRASVTNSGAEADNSSYFPFLSGTGRFVAFTSGATNLDPRCPNPFSSAVFVHDLATEITQCLSTNAVGQPMDDRQADSQGISADGRYVLIHTITVDPVFIHSDLYVFDRSTWTRKQVNFDLTGQRVNASQGALSADGHTVAFYDLDAPADADHLVVRRLTDTGLGAAYTVPRTPLFDAAPCLTPDGRYVFHMGNTARGQGLIMRYDRATRTFRYAGPTPSGPRLSCTADGTQVVFYRAGALLPSDTNRRKDVYLGTIRATSYRLQILSLAPDGSQGNQDSTLPSISPDGHFVTFLSQASNLIGNDTNGEQDVFARNLRTGITWRVDRGINGAQPDAPQRAAVSPPQIITTPAGNPETAYNVSAGNLVPGDTNGGDDVFVTSHQ
jgi:hypothetical protein